ncbi:hypothetical protein [Agrilutibacter solisilvae]|uniref:DUF2007 domain-containing protein n=1 Tax=Agrilutibacter solisilvae TaxID=2763317 RepID=A0A974XY77_9GAMM|nr:hypothetical protein [Lysobacter solisilvae]QSX77135.1 hypothetical protein I8J32_009980 [Lysobacter solisilvae]
MRQVFSSLRLENVERVAQLLKDAGLEVRITDGRSYKGAMRSRHSYADQNAPKPAVWIVRSEDKVRARELLREHGLIESTRQSDSFIPLSFRDDPVEVSKTPAQKRMFRFKVGLLAAMAVIIVLAMLRGCYSRQPDAKVVTSAAVPVPSTAIAAGGTPEALAQAVFARELTQRNMVLCLTVDGRDASPAVIRWVRPTGQGAVPGSACLRDYDPARGSIEKKTGKPALLAAVHSFKSTGANSGTIEFESFHHGEFAHYKTLEVRRTGGRWQVVKVLRHVASFGLSG